MNNHSNHPNQPDQHKQSSQPNQSAQHNQANEPNQPNPRNPPSVFNPSAFNLDNDVVIERIETGYQGFLTIHRYTVKHRLFQGGWSESLQRELLVHDHAVAVLCYDPKEDGVVVIEQFRIGALEAPTGPWLLELVAGLMKPNETPAQVAEREAMEEAGCPLKELIPICQYYSSPGFCNERVHLYLGIIDSTDIGGIHGLVSEHENILVRVVPRQLAMTWLAEGNIINAHTIIALQWLALNLDQYIQS